MNTSLPRWNLTSIYPGPSSREFTQDIEHMQSCIHALVSHVASSVHDAPWLERSLALFEEIINYYETLFAYAAALLTTDTSCKEYLLAVNRVEEVGLGVHSVQVALRNALASEKELVEKFLSEHDTYRFVIEELIEEQKHQMTPAEEDLAADMNRSGSDAWGRLQESVSSSVSVLWDEKTGEKKTVTELRALAYDADRTIRKRAWELELKIWKEHEQSFAGALNGVKGTTLTLYKRRGWSNPLDRSAAQSRITRAVLDVLIEALEKNLPMFRTYLKAKARLLGVEKLAFYDIFAPVGTLHDFWSYEDAQTFITEQFSSFHPPMGDFVSQAFAKNWVDVGPRPGKVGGAYDTFFPLRKESRILTNYDYTFGGVSTLAHELGHAYHDRQVADRPALLRQYPMTLAETASIFSEFIVFTGGVERAGKEDQVSLIEQFVQGACQVCVDILCRFYFEREVFSRRAQGDLTAEEFCSIMIEAQKKTYGDILDEQELHPWMWAVKGHYYNTDLPFYNYPYAFGQLFGLGLYARSRTNPESFAQSYDRLLSITGMHDAVTVAASAGCDITSSEFWQEGMDIIGDYVTRLEEAAFA